MAKNLILNCEQFTNSGGLDLSLENEIEQELIHLEYYFKEHQAFCSLTRSKTADLEAFSSALQRISVRNIEGGLSDTDAVLYKSLVKEIEDTCEKLQSACDSQNKLSDEGINRVCLLSNNAEINNLRVSLAVALNDKQQTILSFLSIANSVKRALALGCGEALSEPRDLEKKSNEACHAARMLLVSVAMIIGSSKSARAIVDVMEAQKAQWHQLDHDMKGIACK